MSFDLYVFDDPDLTEDTEEVNDLLEDDAGWDAPLTEKLANFVSDLERRFPELDDDPDGSPWASWPLTQSVAHGKGCAFNIVWSQAEAMSASLRQACAERGLAIYDPQEDAVIRPSQPKKRWWRR